MASEEIKGIYFESKKIEAGTMATRRVSNEAQDLHYYAKTKNKDEVDLFYLKPDGSPTAIVAETLENDEFEARFHDCSTHKCNFKPRTDDELKKEKAEERVNMGQQHIERKEYNAAAFEFGMAVKQDDQNLEAHLGKGKAHMELGEVDKAKESFEKLSEVDSLYDKDNKHLFNEYGIELRRGEMYDLAIENYNKALSIDQDDEALHYNIGRAYYEDGQSDKAIESLQKAMSLAPDFKEAKLLYDAINRKLF